MTSPILLVDSQDNEIGYDDKMKVHREGLLHRAFSVFVLNHNDELLLQRRAMEKYHSPGLWTNTCCSHAYESETLVQSAHRRLKEEMGFDCDLKEIFTFTYRVEFDNNLIEHEIDHVFVGRFNGIPTPHPAEVCEWKYMPLEELEKDLESNTGNYTFWLKVAFQKFRESYIQKAS